MSEVTAKYRVKPGKVIFHGGERFEEGTELEFVPEVAKVHAPNIELVEDVTLPGEERNPKGKKPKPNPEPPSEDATN